jgi:hypothetical protein
MTIEPVVLQSGRFWLDDEGILRGEASPGAEQGIDEARAQVACQRKMIDGKARPFLMDIRGARALSREARAFYASPEAAEVFSATALLVGSPVSRALGNFFLGLNKTSMPTRLFASTDEALEWLRTFAK